MKAEQDPPFDSRVGRRDLMKMGAGAVMAGFATNLAAQAPTPKDPVSSGGGATMDVVEVGTGWKNEANRAFGNGPMDNLSRQIVSYVNSFDESHMTAGVNTAIGDIMVDTMAAMISGFESEPARISAQLAQLTQGTMKSTVFGYGVSTSPELAAFANTNMVRHTDYNDIEPPAGSHSSVMIPGILAVAEAFHATGKQVMMATALAYEILSAMGQASTNRHVPLDGPYEGMATALACGKVMGLDDDKLANACSLALVPHLPMFASHVGALSMWKGCHSGMGVREGVFAAIMARQGMTGPCQPFEGRGGLWDTVTGPFELKLPARDDGKMIVEIFTFKRFPAEGSTQSMLDQFVPKVRAWTKIDNIASIRVEEPFSANQETADPPKWDPRNRETADHSYAFVMSIGLIDGDVYLNSFTPARFIEDKTVRDLMAKVTIRANPEFKNPRKRITVRKKSGEELVVDLLEIRPMSHEEIVTKFNRVCAYMSVSNEIRDRALKDWSNLKDVKDIAVPMRNLAKFGKPKPLPVDSDMAIFKRT